MHQTSKEPQPSSQSGPIGKIRRAHLSLQRCTDAVLGPRKITTDQCSLLWIVWRRPGIRQNELADELYSDPNTVTAMVVRLERRGLIRRDVCPEDGRARRLTLTASGRRLVARLYEDWSEMRQKLNAIFAGDAGQEALRILDEVCATMTEARKSILEQQEKPSRVRRIAS